MYFLIVTQLIQGGSSFVNRLVGTVRVDAFVVPNEFIPIRQIEMELLTHAFAPKVFGFE